MSMSDERVDVMCWWQATNLDWARAMDDIISVVKNIQARSKVIAGTTSL